MREVLRVTPGKVPEKASISPTSIYFTTEEAQGRVAQTSGFDVWATREMNNWQGVLTLMDKLLSVRVWAPPLGRAGLNDCGSSDTQGERVST